MHARRVASHVHVCVHARPISLWAAHCRATTVRNHCLELGPGDKAPSVSACVVSHPMDDDSGTGTRVPSSVESVAKAALSLVPVVGGALASVLGDELERRRSAARHTAELVAEAVGDGEVLLARLQGDKRLAATFAQAVEAGMRSTMDEKRRAMAKAISRAVLDIAEVDETQLVIAALEDLDVPHLRGLEDLRRRVDEERSPMESPVSRTIEGRDTGLIAPIEAALLRHGCIFNRTTPTYGGSTAHWGVTAFGRHLLNDLHRESDNEDSD